MSDCNSMQLPTRTHHYWNSRLKLLALIAVSGFLLAALFGCVGPHRLYATIDRLTAAGEFSQAHRFVEANEKEYGERNRLLYLLDRGMFAFMAGEFNEAIASFTEAERLMNELYTISLSREATTFIINDNTAPYRGEDFESVMVNLFLALSYANLSQIEDALVEARKIDSKLTAINLQYGEGHKNAYKADPFARLLAGVLYEMGGTSADLNDAFISYRLALKGYESGYQRYGVVVPATLKENILSAAEFMGEKELQELRQRFPSHCSSSQPQRPEKAEVYGLHLNGRAPVKVAEQIVLPLPDGHVVKVAFPRYQQVPKRIATARLRAESILEDREFQSGFTLAEPIGKIAVENLENRRGRVMAKAVVRAAAKYLAVKAAEREMREKYGDLAGMLAGLTGNVLAFASEQADLRSWRTLPAEILVSKLTLPAGSYQLSAECVDASGSLVEKVDLGNRVLKPGDKILLQFRTTQ